MKTELDINQLGPDAYYNANKKEQKYFFPIIS